MENNFNVCITFTQFFTFDLNFYDVQHTAA